MAELRKKDRSAGRRFMEIHGVGRKKRKDYGETFVEKISKYCKKNALEMNVF